MPRTLAVVFALLFALCPLVGQTLHYEFAGSTLTRIKAGQSQVIACTDPEGSGSIHAVARSPWGTIYVAADRGLYSLSDEVVHTTPLPLQGDAPPGKPLCLHIVADSLYLGTDQAFGSVDPVHLVGFTLLRDGPYREIDASGESVSGTWRLRRGNDWQDYPVQELVPPVLQIAESGKASVAGALRVKLQSSSSEKILYGYRHRDRSRFRWQEEPGFAIAGLEPGRQVLEFVAMDAQLQRSNAETLVVDVPYPKALGKAVLLSLVLGSAALVLALLLFAAWRSGAWRSSGSRKAYGRALLSTLLIFVVGLQILAGIFPHARGWPFVGFSMYSNRFDEGQHIYKPVLIGYREKGGSIPINPRSVGYATDGYWQPLLPMIYDGDEKCQEFIDTFNAYFPQNPLRGIAIVDSKQRLTPKGPVEVAPVVMCVYPRGLIDAR